MMERFRFRLQWFVLLFVARCDWTTNEPSDEVMYANSQAARFKKQQGRVTVVVFGQVAWKVAFTKPERHTF
jgi:hypothetical protein